MTSIESAACVVFGEWVPIDTVEIAEPDTPETLLFEKEKFKELSEEGKALINIILNAPEDLFLVNGRVREQVLRRYCRHKKNWSASKVDATKKEIGSFLQTLRF
jgi:hypothetical protein